MSDAVTQALKKLVDQVETPDELVQRVLQSFGESMLPKARQLAAEAKGFDWLRQGRPLRQAPSQEHVKNVSRASDESQFFKEWLNALRSKPSSAVGMLGAVAILLVLAFPPFIVPLTEGLVLNAGFGFLFSPPNTGGSIRAIVNAPLLGVLVLGLSAATGIALIVTRQIEIKHSDTLRS